MSKDELTVKVFLDGASLDQIQAQQNNPFIQGYTTNPTLMRKLGVEDPEQYGREVVELSNGKPVSFEVFADDMETMEAQARVIASWGSTVYVKIPVTNTKGESSCDIIRRLSHDGVQINVTAILTLKQVADVLAALDRETPSIVSIFAGRVADTGIDPEPVMREALEMMKHRPNTELLWASPRELFNVVQADRIGCHIITLTQGVVDKLPLLGKDLDDLSLETVKMFYRDAQASGYSI